MSNYELDNEFVEEYKKFAEEFDLLAVDFFKGIEMDNLAKSFLAKHDQYLKGLPFCAPKVRGQLPDSNQVLFCNDTINEDLEIITAPDECNMGTYGQILAGLYTRACRGSTLRITFNKSRYDQEDDRAEPIFLGRRALRYGPDDFDALYWYMIAVGWQLYIVTSPKERIHLGGCFSQSAIKCIKIKPNDPLPHHLLGRYHFFTAKLSWLEKTFANKLLGCKFASTYEDCERELLEGHRLRKDWLPTGLWMARVLVAQKRPLSEIKEWIDMGLAQDCAEPATEMEKKELLALQKKLKL